MALSVKFTVHSVTPGKTKSAVKHRGETVLADVDCIEVELTSADDHGSLTLRFTGHDAAEARTKFKAGETLTWKM